MDYTPGIARGLLSGEFQQGYSSYVVNFKGILYLEKIYHSFSGYCNFLNHVMTQNSKYGWRAPSWFSADMP